MPYEKSLQELFLTGFGRKHSHYVFLHNMFIPAGFLWVFWGLCW